jgi:hypothetical protein
VTEQRSGQRLTYIVHDLKLSRRTLLRGAALGGAGLVTAGFVGCGDDDDGATPTTAAGGATSTAAGSGTTAPATVENTTFGGPFPAPHAGAYFTHYNAQAQGFWEEESLEVEMAYQTAVVPLIAGETVDYGEVSADELLNAFSAGQGLKAFYQPTYGQQFGFVVPTASPITEWTAEQITGTTIGITELAGGEVPICRAALAEIGLSEGDQVTFFPTSGDNQAVTVDAFNTGKIDIFAGSVLDHAAVEVSGMTLRAITPDFILNASGDNAVAVRADFLDDEEVRGQLVRFGRGMAKAKVWSFAPANFEAALDAALAAAPDTGPRDEVTKFVEILHINRALAAPVSGIAEGEIWMKGWDDYQRLLLAGSTGSPDDPLTFTEPIDINEVADNSLVAEIFDFDREEIIARPAR